MFTVQEIAAEIGATVRGDPTARINGTETIAGARPGDLTFAVDGRHLEELQRCRATAAIVPAELAGPLADGTSIVLLICPDCLAAFTQVARKFRPARPNKSVGISAQAFVSDSARIDSSANIFPGVYVGENVVIESGATLFPGVTVLDGSRIGRDVTIFPNAVLYEGTMVADRCVIHAGAVLGAWGFGYQSGPDGHKLTEQLGHVELSEDVEVGACSTVDRGTWGATRIGSGSKLDNQVMIGHNCQIGCHNMLCSQVGIAGSSRTGSFVVMAGQVGIADHMAIGDHAVLGAQAGVMHNLDGNETYLGATAVPVREQMHMLTALGKLPQMRREFRKLQKRVDQIAGTADAHEPDADTDQQKAA